MSWGKALIWGTVIVAVLTCSTSSSCVAALGRYGLKSWIEAAKKRLHHNVLAIAHGVLTAPAQAERYWGSREGTFH